MRKRLGSGVSEVQEAFVTSLAWIIHEVSSQNSKDALKG
jgi:hypothetical protein